MNRRRFLQTTAVAGSIGTAGCLESLGLGDDDSSSDVPRPGGYGDDAPLVQDPPQAAYIPTHREGMVMPGAVRAGEYAVGPMVSQHHPFWLVTGETVEPVEVQPEDSVHLMITVWDPETRTVLPSDEGLSIEIYRDGDPIEELSPWSMLSQSMGVHFGDNVPLDGDGTYEIQVTVPPIGTDKTGSFEGRFEESATATFEFTFDQAFRDTVFDRIAMVDEENWGVRGAIEPGGGMDGEMDGAGGPGPIPFSELPPSEALPGALLGDPSADDFPKSSDDAAVPATIVDGESRFGSDPYLLVSPRTPYNRNPLPATALTAVLEENGDFVAETPLEATLDDETGLHYGAAMPELASADTVTIVVDAPPQTARHQGYETAFIDMDDIEYEIDL